MVDHDTGAVCEVSTSAVGIIIRTISRVEGIAADSGRAVCVIIIGAVIASVIVKGGVGLCTVCRSNFGLTCDVDENLMIIRSCSRVSEQKIDISEAK